MEWLANLDWKTILTVVAFIAIGFFMFKFGCGSMCGMGGHKQDKDQAQRSREKTPTGKP